YVVCAERFESSYLENLGKGKFRIKPLPIEAQFSPTFGTATVDYNKDGNLDVLLVGNSYSTEVISGKYDASIGLYLQGDGKGNFKPLKSKDSGFSADGDSKGMAKFIAGDGNELIIVSNNSDRVRVYSPKDKGKYYRAKKDDAYALVKLSNGKVRKHEFYYGSTYLSQSSRALKLDARIVSLEVFDSSGNEVSIELNSN
ncbi:MAG: RNA-binding protein, partial [Bacteroidia bacterium]|nr:RNA-binding protein [Bacteroidia bacterium]